MDIWIIWLLLAVLLGIAEIFTLTAALGLLGVAALLTAGLAALEVSLPLQLLTFAVASTAGLVLIRPIAARHMYRPPPSEFGVEALVGRTAYVIEDVTAHRGTVRIGGEDWTARAWDDSAVIPVGARVNVLRIEGATAVVYPGE